jgi:uncharacterized protein YegP (UPF0339 family)
VAGKFALKKSSNGKHHFNLLASNGQGVPTSEMYESRASALDGIESVKKNAADAARHERAGGAGGKPCFTLRAANHQVIGLSQRYDRATTRDAGAASVMKHAPDAPTDDKAGG